MKRCRIGWGQGLLYYYLAILQVFIHLCIFIYIPLKLHSRLVCRGHLNCPREYDQTILFTPLSSWFRVALETTIFPPASWPPLCICRRSSSPSSIFWNISKGGWLAWHFIAMKHCIVIRSERKGQEMYQWGYCTNKDQTNYSRDRLENMWLICDTKLYWYLQRLDQH